MAGSRPRRSPLSLAQRAIRRASASRRSVSSKRKASIGSLGRRRAMTMSIDRSTSGSGNCPIKAMATAAKQLKARTSWLSPTVRIAGQPRRWPLLRMRRRLSSPSSRKTPSASSISSVGRKASMMRKIAAVDTLAAGSGRGTRRVMTSRSVVLPEPLVTLRTASRGVIINRSMR